MAVGLRKPWFHPIAYFLVDRVDAQMQAQIIKEAIKEAIIMFMGLHSMVVLKT
jgi:hypothetical protein